jgi:HK97 family phage prohead protease
MADTFRPPQNVQDEAKRALKWIADGFAGSGFTDVGRTRASQLARGEALSAETILRMFSYLSRHEVDKQGKGFNAGDEGYPSAGRVAWAAWGGDAGFTWSTKIRNQLSARAALLEGQSMIKRDAIESEVPDLPEELSELLADVVSFYFRAHGAHWNVKGSDFNEYHALFNEIYEDVYSSIDPIAENLRKLGSLAPFRLNEFTSMTMLSDAEVGQDPMALARDLLLANDIVLDQVSDSFDCATMLGQQGIANFLADRMDKHQFWKWQLTASLGEEVTEPNPDPLDAQGVDEDDVEEESQMMISMYSSEEEAELESRSGEIETETPEDSMLEERKSAIASAERLEMSTEIRAMDSTDGQLRVGGYAAQFNKEATGLSFREMIAPGAFKRTLQSGEPVYLLVNHDTNGIPLASTSGGTLNLFEDEIGLRMEADLDPANPKAQELFSAISRGDIAKMSFAFTVAPDGSTREEGLRTLSDVNLFEVSAVTWPAYNDTALGLRTLEDAEQEALELRKRLLELKQKFTK